MSEQQTVWMVGRAEDPGGVPCTDRDTARGYAEIRHVEDEYNGDAGEAELTWDEFDDLIDQGQYTGWTVYPTALLRPVDLSTAE
ncbi:hypothetical protein [Streptomyces sp. 7N604]|uniref:hypothetical protein n=1 Tax=Streptomyces sp. 7N604 TaxID=3457415 RepID=UPI003FD386F7